MLLKNLEIRLYILILDRRKDKLENFSENENFYKK